MNVATILKFKGGGVVTTTANKSCSGSVAGQRGIGCIVVVGGDDKIQCRSAISCGRSAKGVRKS